MARNGDISVNLHTVSRSNELTSEKPRGDLCRRQAAGLALALNARAHHEIRRVAFDGGQHVGDHLGAVAAIAIDEEKDAALQ